jgi:two-component system, sporulation sensor kinase E
MKLEFKITALFFIISLLLTSVVIHLVKTGYNAITLIFIIPLIIGLIGYLISRILFYPINKLLNGIKIIRSGNLDYKVSIDTKDEIGQLSKSFDKITEDLRKTMESMYLLNQKTSEFKETERELQASEKYFRRLFEYSNDAVFIYNFDGKLLDINKKACEMLGYSKEEFSKILFLDLQIKEELTKSKEAFKTSTNTGSIRFESIFERKNGSRIDVEISSSIVDLKKGIMQSIVSNITERKKIEKSLRESEEKFRTFMETASDLMYITNADGYITYANKAMINTLGYSKEEIIGMQFQEILDKDNLEDARIERKKLLEVGEDIHQLIWETKNRRKIIGEMKAVAIFDNEGQFQGIRGIFRDISERKKVEESQRLAEMGKLAADMAHEVNNQLMIISTRTKISLMRKPKDKELEKDLTVVVKQCDQIKDIVKRLLMFSKPSKRDFKEADINESIDFVIDLVEKQFLLKNVKIKKNFMAPLPLVKIDEKQMQEVFMNLLRNSFEAMNKEGVILISTFTNNDNVQIDFKDTGSGISDSDMENIFNPFFTTKEHGTGLGLSVCYGIIKAHNGDLKYTSKPGEGTTASILLPSNK